MTSKTRAVLEEKTQPAAEPVLTNHEQVTERALLAAVFGILVSPLELYALWLLVPVFAWLGPLGRIGAAEHYSSAHPDRAGDGRRRRSTAAEARF